VPKKAPNDLYLSNVTPSVVCLDANKSGGGGGLLLLLLRRERERERAKGDAVLVVFSASTRWLWWKRTTGLIQTRRLCDFCWDYGLLGEYSNPFFVVQIAPIQNRFASSSSKRTTTKRRFFFSTKKEEDAGKGNFDDSVLLAASWKKAIIIALHPKEKDKERGRF